MRIAFTIIYQGLHHLNNKGFADFMAKNFDYWIVIEGLSRAGGSTGWCRNVPLPARSDDGTHEFMEGFSRQRSNVIYFSPGEKWKSKDDMVNEAIKIARLLTDSCYLWQVDADEIWKVEDLAIAESELEQSGYKAGAFQFDQLLCITDDGRQLVAHGEWGSGFHTRLFNWKGERFLSHEPPIIEGQKEVATLTPRYEHYSYTHERDVRFKSIFYKGHEQVYSNWKKLKSFRGSFPQSLSMLFGKSKKFNPNNSFIDVLKPNLSCKQKDAAAAPKSQE